MTSIQNKNIHITETDEKDITTKLVEQRNERQYINNKNAYDAIKHDSKNPKKDNINEKALERIFTFTGYENLEDIKRDKVNYEENIMKLSALCIAKNASRQGIKDESLQLENINILQEYDIHISKDGKIKPIKGGGIRKTKIKKIDELKTIDFLITRGDNELGYITAKVSSGEGGHQDNVLEELSNFCEWTLIQQQNDKEKKCYIVLYDSSNTSNMINEIINKYKNDNLIITNTKNFKNDFLKWFNVNYILE